jgi:chaperonin GroEL
MESLKAKTPAKIVLTRSMDKLKKLKRETMRVVVEAVGGTLGPGGHPVLIERPEYGLPPVFTKDGVTVFRALGFKNAVQHCLMEGMRDASIRTANEAGDGTTTATILAGAFSDLTEEFRERHPTASPRLICSEIQKVFDEVLRPSIDLSAISVDLEHVGDPAEGEPSREPSPGRRAARAVACISANGDEELADAVMRCFDICGDEGNVTITESSGPSHYEVVQVQGYPLPTGYELSCARYYDAFINDPGTQRCILDKPLFVLYFGRISDVQTLLPLQNKIQEAWAGDYLEAHNVVLVATGFSEAVLAHLAYNFVKPSVINVFPVVVPQTPFANGTRHFLDDLAAVVGGTVCDPINHRLEDAQLVDLGNLYQDTDDPQQVWKPLPKGVSKFEASRYRSTVLGYADPVALKKRWAELKQLSTTDVASQLDADYLRERMAKLTGGIAHLRVIGSSNGELKERRDRAEDAVCAVRGALASGGLIGGCHTLMRLRELLPNTPVCQEIVKAALQRPLEVLLFNAGLSDDEAKGVIAEMAARVCREDNRTTFNAATMEWVDGMESGLLDSVPAVREALKNAISIATLNGTLGAVIVQARDREFEMTDARDAAEFTRQVDQDWNPADERA